MTPDEVVAITGASGFLAQHLVAHLQRNCVQLVSQIRLIDRKPFEKFLEYPNEIPCQTYQLDICDEEKLQEALNGCTTVFHCAGKQFVYVHTEKDPNDDYWHDNTFATDALLEVMERAGVPRLVFVGDAYANLPVGDNYGLSEEMHSAVPPSFMLRTYGESKTRAELSARKAAEKGKIQAIFLRPTFIFGEGERHLTTTFLTVCSRQGSAPYIIGDNRGNHQYIYAGNMAAIMVRSMVCLRKEPSKFNGEIVICSDCTTCICFRDFITPYMEASGFRVSEKVSYLSAFATSIYNEFLYKIGSCSSIGRLTFAANRFLNGWTVGFSNRKLRLLLDFIPPVEQSEAMRNSLAWYHEHLPSAPKDIRETVAAS